MTSLEFDEGLEKTQVFEKRLSNGNELGFEELKDEKEKEKGKENEMERERERASGGMSSGMIVGFSSVKSSVSSVSSASSVASDTSADSKELDKDDKDEKDDMSDKEDLKDERIESGFMVDKDIPCQLSQVPFESLVKFDQSDEKMKQCILNKYGKMIESFDFWPSNTIDRYVIGYKHFKNENERIEQTLFKFEKYIKFHKEFHFGNILSMKEYNDDKFLKLLNEELLPACPYFMYGIDNQGHPIMWDDGTGSACKIHSVFTNEDGSMNMFRIGILRSILMRRMYNLKYKLSNYYNHLIFQHTIVINLEHMSVSEFSEQITKNRHFHVTATQDLSDIFPEVVFQMYIINAPLAFRMVWKMIQKFIDPLTVKKTKVLGSDYLNEMTKYIDINMIPQKYGGKGKWDIRLGNVPKNFPFETDDELLPKISQFS